MAKAAEQSEGQTHALYPGSFDGLTNGHLDLVRRAAEIFPRVTVAVAENLSKRIPLFTTAERVEMLKEHTREFPGVSVRHFNGLTVEFARSIGATVIIRGLRAVSDFDYEFQMAMLNENQAPELTTVFMAPSPRYFFLSSSAVKELASVGGRISDFVPPAVERRIMERIGREK